MHIIVPAGFILAAAFAASTDQSPPGRPSQIARRNANAGLRVTIEGKRRINLACLGRGSTTVIFLSGLGGGTYDWRKVQPAVGKVARACAYDRAGYGHSDPAFAPSDVTSTVKDLHALLGSKAVTKPVILVGHSLGGLFATNYALRYPKEVAGVVLIDPSFSGQEAAIDRAIGPIAAQALQEAKRRTLTFLDDCIAEAEAGRLSAPSAQASPCLDNPPDRDPGVHRERNRVAKSPAYHQTVRSEFETSNMIGSDGMTIDDRQSHRSNGTLGAMPLAVLTRGKMARLPGLSDMEAKAAEKMWRTGHYRLAELSTSGKYIVVSNAGHFIQLDQPDAVIEEILRIVSIHR
ncbi:MAG: alpha/beta hydrolase [Oxalobacteraceae bacterium]|nr:MAG: alpha/beta hydrolase [Oxalobacteraceae bacterium]